MRNKPVTYQFWLDIGSQGWWARLDQPLTQPYVLNRNWQHGKQWTDLEEFETIRKPLPELPMDCSITVVNMSICAVFR